MDANRFGGQLRAMREKAGLSQKQLADRAGLSQKAISFWETGEREPGWSAVEKLCAALGVSCEVFRGPSAAADAQPPRGRGRPPKAEAPGQAGSSKGKGKGKPKK